MGRGVGGRVHLFSGSVQSVRKVLSPSFLPFPFLTLSLPFRPRTPLLLLPTSHGTAEQRLALGSLPRTPPISSHLHYPTSLDLYRSVASSVFPPMPAIRRLALSRPRRRSSATSPSPQPHMSAFPSFQPRKSADNRHILLRVMGDSSREPIEDGEQADADAESGGEEVDHYQRLGGSRTSSVPPYSAPPLSPSYPPPDDTHSFLENIRPHFLTDNFALDLSLLLPKAALLPPFEISRRGSSQSLFSVSTRSSRRSGSAVGQRTSSEGLTIKFLGTTKAGAR